MNSSVPSKSSAAEPTPRPWWTHGHVWMIISGPAIVVVAGFVTLWLAIRTPDPVIEADYYKRGMEINKTLVNDFFAHVASMLRPGGQVHVTHKTKPPFGQWEIDAIAARHALDHTRSVIFDRCLYAGYSNKKVLSKGSFPIWDSETFVFVPHQSTEASAAKEQEDDGVPLVKVTATTLQLVYTLLSPTVGDTLTGSKKKKRKSEKLSAYCGVPAKSTDGETTTATTTTSNKRARFNHKAGDKAGNKKHKQQRDQQEPQTQRKTLAFRKAKNNKKRHR